MKSTVETVMARRAQSQIFTRCCCFSEKKAKQMTMSLIAAALIYFCYLQIMVMIKSYASPAQNTVYTTLNYFLCPGIRLCQVSSNLSSPYFFEPSQNTFYTDPRTAMAQYVDFNNGNVVTAGLAAGTPVLIDCCVSTSIDFFTDCYTNLASCPSKTTLRTGIAGYYAGAYISFDCIDINPGLTVPNGASIYIPFYMVQDQGILAYNLDGNVSTSVSADFDPMYLNFCNNYQFWPKKLALYSYEPNENTTDAINLFYGAFDGQVGGRGRWRIDLNRGISSMGVTKFVFYDTAGVFKPFKSGYVTFYNLGLTAIPWLNFNSPWDSTGVRQRLTEFAYTNIQLGFSLQTTNQQVLFPWLSIVTVFLSVIASSTVMIQICVGPGEYDPKGLLNKFFFFDVPMLRDAASTIVLKVGDGKKKKGGRAGGKKGKKGTEDKAEDKAEKAAADAEEIDIEMVSATAANSSAH